LKKLNRGSWISAERSREQRANNRAIIKSMPNYSTGFTRHDIPLDVSVARRELQEMTKDGILMVDKKPNGYVYRAAPASLLSIKWRIDESVYRELEESLADL
jgi:hypothetical protein